MNVRGWRRAGTLCMLLGLAVHAHAASFDCKKATTDIEHAICADEAVGNLDEQIGRHYRDLLDVSPRDQAATIRTTQRNWLATRDVCKDAPEGVGKCLARLFTARNDVLVAATTPARLALDHVIERIPRDPAGAAEALRQYNGPLASAWLVYLHRYEPGAGVSDAEAKSREAAALKGLSDDSFASDVYNDVRNDPRGDSPSLTLLRMVIERSDYDVDGARPYVHCFVFTRQGDAAYKAFGPLYGSTRDSFAPVCAPTGDLFKQAAWKKLDAAMKPAIGRATDVAGTIRYSSFVAWSILDLRATLTPRDLLKPLPKEDAGDAEKALREGYTEKTWSKTERDTVLASVAPARQATSRWLVAQRGFSPGDADKAAHNLVQAWLAERISFIDDNIDNGD
ncbi:lysozyme inhibitor LprI family protein [Dyella sp.]|uniref:lysozyme inhibitor LprI family protein n=1 Tax=Dyella sp. TaxID=1869338 RepID=UPI002ED22161